MESALASTRASSVEATSLRVAVARIHRALRTSPGQMLTASQSSALARIEQSGPVRLGVLATLEGVSAATMSKVVDSLEESGFVQRVSDADDRRVSVVQLSPNGVDALAELRRASTLAIARAIGCLDPVDRERLNLSLPVLEQLADLITESPSPPADA